MRHLVVYSCFLIPHLLTPVICSYPNTQKPSAFWISALIPVICSHPTDRNQVPFGSLLPGVVVPVPAGSCCISIMCAPLPGAHFLSPGWLHTPPGLSRLRPGHAGRCWPSADKSKWYLMNTPHCPKSPRPLLRVPHECRPVASLHPESVLLLPTPQCRLLCYRAHTSPAQSPRATATSPSKYSKFCTRF